MRGRRAIVASSLACCSWLAACAPRGPSEPGTAQVVDVIDGDTLDVRIGGHTETVRLLGVDTPETKHPTRPVECFGPEASARLDELLPRGADIRLERDVEARDRFGRLLAYVYRLDDGLFVNEALLVDGFAEVLVIEPNGALASPLRAAQAEARSARRGLWGRCGATSSQ
jgi:micrococcal nuclease